MRRQELTIALLAALLAAVQLVSGQSASELLQRGIYTQETVGDLEGAIKIYQKILTDSRDARVYAAQAQYRLGVCLLKKGRDMEAAEAFEKVTKDFPDQKEVVAEARKHLTGNLTLGPEPWVDGEILQMTIKLQGGMEIGTFLWTADSVDVQGKSAWRFQIYRFLAGGANRGVSRAVVDRATFRPLSSWFRHSMLGEGEVQYGPKQAVVNIKGQEPGRKVDLEGLIYDNEQGAHLFRRLPLAVGYRTTTPILVPFSGKLLPLGVEVTAKETVEVPAGKFECYKVDLPSIAQTFWISTDHNRYTVKFVGDGAVGELSAIRRGDRYARNQHRDEKFGLSIEAPPGWIFYQFAQNSRSSVYFLDPDSLASSSVSVEPLEGGKPASEQEMRAHAAERVTDRQKQFKNYQVKPESWQHRIISERPHLSYVAEYTDTNRTMVEYVTWVTTAASRSRFVIRMEAANFDGFKPKIDGIIASYAVR